jgi:CRP-like cAMP-binding protein
MFEAFEKYIREKIMLTDEEMQLIQSVSILKKMRKRQYLLQGGDISRHMSFIAKGFMRLYRVSDDGTEHVLRFAPENYWISDRESYTTGLPTKYNIDALEDSVLITWTKENWTELKQKIPALVTLEEQLLARSFNVNQNRINDTISLTAEEKYQKFLKIYPDIFNRVPLHMVASYLGVTRETLSRIRHQFTNK